MVVFNEIHNKHLQTSIGIVSILTEDKKWKLWRDMWRIISKLWRDMWKIISKLWSDMWELWKQKKYKNQKF